MTSADESLDATLLVVEQVLEALRGVNADAVTIGAMALAVHNYARATVDFDLATAIEPQLLDDVARVLRARGFAVEVHMPDAADPLGGVIDVRGDGAELVQVVNFWNPPAGGFPRLVADALQTAALLIPGRAIKVADLPHLIAFKLYAVGRKSQLDILELLERNPSLDLHALRALCKSYRLDEELDEIAGPDLDS